MRAPRVAIGATAAVFAGVGAGGAFAAPPAWHAPVPIAPQGSHPGAPAVGLAPRGEALAAWPALFRGRIVLDVRQRHGLRAPWTAPEILSRPPAGQGISPPVVAINARGDAVVLWGLAGGTVRSAVRRGWTGSWRRMPVASSPPGAPAGAEYFAFVRPQVQITPDGGAAAIWATAAAGVWIVRGAHLGPRAAAWEETPAPPLDPDRVAPPGGAPRLALDALGDALVLWLVPSSSTTGSPLQPYALRATRRIGLGAWGQAITLADPVRQGDASLATDGRAAVVWTDYATSSETAIHLAPGDPGTTGFSAPQTLPWSGSSARVAVNARGEALVAWTIWALDPEVHAAIRAAAGSWGPRFSAPGGPVEPLLALDEGGTGHVGAFYDDPSSQAHEWPFSVVAGGASGWAAPRVVANGDAAASLATAPDGAALILARASEGPGIFASSYDGLPDVRVVARARGRWNARWRTVCWTVRVRNAGRIAAQGVRVRLRAGERGRLLSSRPAAARNTGRTPLWRLGRLGPGAQRTIRAVIRPRDRSSRANLGVTVFAGAMPPAWSPWSVATPSR